MLPNNGKQNLNNTENGFPTVKSLFISSSFVKITYTQPKQKASKSSTKFKNREKIIGRLTNLSNALNLNFNFTLFRLIL